ncbi:MAG: hypothetical protein V7679_07105 [Parasphingorhabdus sp.]
MTDHEINRKYKSSWEIIRNLIIALPFTHAIFCFIFLISYFRGFGGNIELFSDPSDIFTVSISDVATTYVMVFFGGLFSLWQINVPFRSLRDGGYSPPKQPKCLKWMVYSLIAAGVSNIGLSVYLYVMLGMIEYRMASIGIMLLLMTLLGKWLAENGFSFRISFAAMLGFVILMTLISSGLSDGQRDRYLAYSSFPETLAKCGQNIVVRKMSSNFLAIASDNSRRIVDADCKTLFIFEPPENLNTYGKRPWNLK